MLDDVTSATLNVALAGLAERQRVTANNIANVETPNFSATRVDFEQNLADAIASGDPTSAAVSIDPTGDPAGINGNNVSLDSEFVDATKTTLQQQLLSQALTSHYAQLATVLKG